ncbi:unnamed protein product, partial [Urochloa humidicola]
LRPRLVLPGFFIESTPAVSRAPRRRRHPGSVARAGLISLPPKVGIMSRQARKEAAAATRDLLKVDSSRVRKASGAPMHKPAAAMRKPAAGPEVADVHKLLSRSC